MIFKREGTNLYMYDRLVNKYNQPFGSIYKFWMGTFDKNVKFEGIFMKD